MKIIENYFNLNSLFKASAFPSHTSFSQQQHRLYSSCDDPESIFKGCTSLIAIPARNEELYIADCLMALARQSFDRRHGVVLLLNNCTDQTSAVIRGLATQLPMPVLVIETTLPAKFANAGMARRLAMEAAARLAAPNGILMTTDADGQVYPNWINANLSALRAGAEVVAGRAELNVGDATRLPRRLQDDDEKECHYDRLLDEIHARLDPDPADPWPRHTEHSGASIAVTLDAYRKSGGIPSVPVGEDRAFIEALRRVDARIRHAPEVRVIVSGRIVGRAPGGMADTIRRRLAKSDEALDARLEPARIAAERAWMRGFSRQVWTSGKRTKESIEWLSRRSKVPAKQIEHLLASSGFGEAWFQLESHSPALQKLPVFTRELPKEMRMARTILETLDCQNFREMHGPADRGDSPESAADQIL